MYDFCPKTMVYTSGIQACLENGEIKDGDLIDCLHRHLLNLGEECKDDNKLNREAIKNKDGRVVSLFKNCGNRKIFIITDGLHLANDPVYGDEYPATTILLPEEY